MTTRVLVFCVALLTAPAVAAQSRPELDIAARQGDHYWVVITAPDGSRRAGWVRASVPLDRIDPNTLAPLPASASSNPQTLPPDAAVNERLLRIEQTLATQGGRPDAAGSTSGSLQPSALFQTASHPDQPPALTVDGKRFHAGTVELLISGSFTGMSVDGVSTSGVILSTFLGAFATPRIEFGISATVLKLESLDTTGDVMGHFFFNFPNNSAIVPFVGIGVGTTFGYAALVGHPATLDVSGGFRAMMPGGGGALVFRPFFQRAAVASDYMDMVVNTWGVSIGASLLF